MPARNKPLTETFKQEVKETADEIRFNMHQTTSGHPWGPEPRLAMETAPEERERIYQDAWDRGGLQFRASFQDIMVDTAANETAADFVTRKIRDLVKDPETARKLTAFDHGYSTKRPLMRLNVTGRDGLSLNEFWKDGPKNYLGLQVAGFPNMFTITGPGSPSVLTNMPVACEQHAEWITACIGHMREQGADRVETNSTAMNTWGEKVQEAAQATLLITAKSSWYLGTNVPGKPRVFLPYAGGMAKYRQICADVAANGYDGFAFSTSG